MKYFIFRNSTVETLLEKDGYSYSGYNDIISIDDRADALVWLYLLPIRQERKQLIAEIESYFQNIEFIYKRIPKNKEFLIFTLYDLHPVKYQNNDFSVEKAISEFNNKIIHLANEYDNIKVIDLSEFVRQYSSEQLIDWKYYFIAEMQINPALAKPFSDWFNKQAEAIMFKRKKCIVLDLDNTLWGGILGEDGTEGIKIGGDYPGNAYLMFQENLVELSKAGVILTICSKNNEQDVLNLWDNNPFIKLSKEFVAAYRINWNNKAENIKDLAGELNIGLDSMVFIDDNPAEREMIKQLLPMIEVPEFPKHPYELPSFFKSLRHDYFGIYSITEEDKLKTQQYKANAERGKLQQSFGEFTDYLKSLEMEIIIQQANKFNIPRIAQLTQKTNQFNLTTKRYDEKDIQKIIDRNNLIFCMSERDKFGDNGITGVIILNRMNDKEVEIDTLLLSCRILGKGIEKAFLFKILDLLKQQSIKNVRATYCPTLKNIQVKEFYEKIGFSIASELNAKKSYNLELAGQEFLTESYFKIEYNE